MNYLKVKDNPSLIRDKSSKAILNTDIGALNKYKYCRNQKLIIKSHRAEITYVSYTIAN